MNIKKLNDFNKAISISVTVILLAVFLLSISSLYFYSNFISKQSNIEQGQIQYTNELLQSELSEKMSIIANSPIFLNFLRSGTLTRSYIEPDFLEQVLSLKTGFVTGMKINNISGQEMFITGSKTDTYVNVDLCYLNLQLNNTYGTCDYSWTLYINKIFYFNALTSQNSNIHLCFDNTCKKYSMLKSNYFGSFPIADTSGIYFNLKVISPGRLAAYFISVMVMILSLIIFGIWVNFSIKKMISKRLITPVVEISNSIKNDNTLPITHIEELDTLVKQVEMWKSQFLENQRYESQAKLGKIAAQVAHDIRSPLAALQIFTEQNLPELEESKRILLRDATYQIRDILNNLDEKAAHAGSSVTQIAILLENVLSERKAAFANKTIKFHESFPPESYGLFIIAPSEIRRVITNLINNAVEAMPNHQGNIELNIESHHESITITIKDNGAGISETVIHSLFERGFTTKETGSGLGLFHAKETLTKLGGNIEIQSKPQKGTAVILTIPLCEPPSWFVNLLPIPDNSCVVCVDDSVSIWNIWQERFKLFANHLELLYCKDKAELLLALANQSSKPYTYLVDHEFSGQDYTGLDLIEKIIGFKKSEDQIFLVTSRSGEPRIQAFCHEKAISIIPKFFASKMPIKIVEKN